MPRVKSSPLTVTGDAKEALHTLLNAKAAGITLSAVSVGTCRLEVREPAPGPSQPDQSDRDPRSAMYAQFGGEMYRRMMGRPSGDAVVQGEEYQPALEAG